MTKKRSRSLFVIFSIILVVLLVASFVNFTYPFSLNGNYYSFSNFVSNLRLGEDISSSLRIVYRAEPHDGDSGDNYGELRKSTMEGLKDIMQGEGYKDVTVASMAEDKIVLQVGNILTKTDEYNINYLIGEPAAISIYSQSTKTGDPIATAKDISSVEVKQGFTGEDYVYYVEVGFKDIEKVKRATESVSSVYIFFGDSLFTSNGVPLSESGIPDGYLTIQGTMTIGEQSVAWDKNTATSYANKIRTGMLPLSLTALENEMITPSYGNGANILVAVVLGLFVLAGFIYLIVRYRQLGWLACFNLLFFLTINLFLLQSIPILHVNFSGIIAMAICYVLAISSTTMIFERAKKYYNQDTKLYVSLRVAQNESAMKIFIFNLLFIVLGFACVFMPSMAIQSMGWIFLVMPIVNLFTTLALMRLFIAMYSPLNNTDGKKCNFHKGGENA